MKINHEYTDEAVCPHCGFEYHDTWERFRNTDKHCVEIECYDCKKSFRVEIVAEISVVAFNYSTYKKEV